MVKNNFINNKFLGEKFKIINGNDIETPDRDINPKANNNL